ncbi:MAG: Y-family DNA polymerase [Halothiobacillaceae bacterium]
MIDRGATEYWLALRFRALALEALGVCEAHVPALVLSGEGARARVWSASEAAVAQGILPGMRWSAARTRMDAETQWRVLARDPRAEADRLEQLALWAGRFSSRVVKQTDPPGLVMELGGGRALFGTVECQVQTVRAELASQGVTAAWAGAPVLAAAWALAGFGAGGCHDRPGWLGAVCRLPVEALEGQAEPVRHALRSVGIDTVAACLRQPRAELVARHGQALSRELDELTGRRPRPVNLHELPPQFVQRLPLDLPTASAEGLLMVTRRLLVALEGYLRGRRAEIAGLEWRLAHENHPDTIVRAGWRQAQSRAETMLEALRLQAERLVLPEPVQSVAIHADRIDARAPATPDLFGLTGNPAATLNDLLDRLGARLGSEALFRIDCTADPRPGADTLRLEPAAPWQTATTPLPARAARPLWLCVRPVPARPVPAAILEDEYIESGWWTDRPCRALFRRGLGPGHSLSWFQCSLSSDETVSQTAGWVIAGYFG